MVRGNEVVVQSSYCSMLKSLQQKIVLQNIKFTIRIICWGKNLLNGKNEKIFLGTSIEEERYLQIIITVNFGDTLYDEKKPGSELNYKESIKV